uniref:Aa_trans domain-containing protein n=1 Tax=Meloidogyne hapla TaxID=6305 RepID=A0A1I8BFU2_MELHA
MFATIDFGIFGIFLLLSLFVGLYHGIGRSSLLSKSEQHTTTKTGDFLDGGRRLPVFPVCLSLLTTFVSGIGLLGVPAEIYTRGSGMFIYIMSGTLAFPIIGIFFIPIFYKIKVVIYAPSIALSGVTQLPLWPFILLVGTVSTFYTAAGGIKAVIWTDTLQASFIYLGLGIIIVKGTIEAGQRLEEL